MHLSDVTFIQKIYSSTRYICFQLYGKGGEKYLYVGRGHGYEGIWFGENKIEAKMRCKDKLLEYLRKHLSSTVITGLKIDGLDRIVSIAYQKWGKKNEIYFFWRGRELLILNQFYEKEMEATEYWSTWDKDLSPSQSPEEIFNSIGRKKLESNMPKLIRIKKIEELLQEEWNAHQGKINQDKSQPKILRKIEKIKDDIRKLDEAVSCKNQLIMIDPNFFDKKDHFNLGKFKVKFQNCRNNFQKKDLLFKNLKKFEDAIILQRRRLNLEEEKIKNNSIKLIQYATLRPIQPVWDLKKNTSAAQNIPKKIDQAYQIFDYPEFKVGVGLNAQGNDQLRKEWAKSDDLWIHLEDLTSAHAIIKVKASSGIKIDWIEEAAKVIAKNSGIKSPEFTVVYTNVKNIKGVTGKSGMVIFKKEKRLKVSL